MNFNRTSLSQDLLKVRLVSSEEIAENWQLDITSFENSNLTLEQVVSWWNKYKKGVYALYNNSEVLGYISCWPVTFAAYEGLISGVKLEHQICDKDIVSDPKLAEQSYWYIGSIMLSIKYRKSRLLIKFLNDSIVNILIDLKSDKEISLCAFAYSLEGERILSRLKFDKHLEACQSSHGHSIYIAKLTVENLKMQLMLAIP